MPRKPQALPSHRGTMPEPTKANRCPACAHEEAQILAGLSSALTGPDVARLLGTRYPLTEGPKIRFTTGRFGIARQLRAASNACAWHIGKALRVGKSSCKAMIGDDPPTPHQNRRALRQRARVAVACPTCQARVGEDCRRRPGRWCSARRALWSPVARSPRRRHV